MQLRERLLSKVTRDGPMGFHWLSRKRIGRCWSWLAKRSNGYGYIYVDGAMRQAHRVAYIIFAGAIPTGLQIDHVCRNRGCVNPEHLETVTQAENIRRGRAGENLVQMQKAKTHCPHGHEYSAANTYCPPGSNTRMCITCCRVRTRAWRKKGKP